MKHRKFATILAFLFLSFSLSACGKQQPVETSAEAEVEIEAEESEVEEEEETEEETAEASNYTGYSHYIDPEEAAAKAAAESESEAQEDEQSDAEDKTDETEVASSETQKTEARGETKVAEQTEAVAPASETVSALAQETYTDTTIPDSITMDPNFVKCSMYVVYDTQVKDAPYAASGDQGLISRGSNIGVMERCIETGYYRVNYGAKAGYLPPDALTMEDPFK